MRDLFRFLYRARTTLLFLGLMIIAMGMLVDGNAPLTAIAFDVGCASLQHFSALFRRRTQESPSAFRARHHHVHDRPPPVTPPGEAAPRRG